MPTYSFQCDNCNYKFDKFQKITAKTLRKCPKCKKKTLVRLIGSGGGIIFKGPGFFCNDYGKSKEKGI